MLWWDKTALRHHRRPSSGQTFQHALPRLVRDAPADSQEVGDAIYTAVLTDTSRFRHVVGATAQRIARMRQTTDFEEFEGFMCETLDWRIGTNPSRIFSLTHIDCRISQSAPEFD